MARIPNVPQQLSSTHVLVRFSVRTLLLVGFATFGNVGFGTSLAALLWMAIILCGVIGVVKREALFGPTLNHWDEGVAYVALFALISVLDHFAAT